MSRKPKKSSHPFFKMPKEITTGQYLRDGRYIKTKLGEYLGPYAILVYNLIGNKLSGDRKHDEGLICIAADASHFMSRSTFSKGVFRCWAYRLIVVHRWGGGRWHDPARYQLILKWRTLIRMPDKLERIHKLVVEHEALMRVQSNPSPKNLNRRKSIKSKIKDIIV